MQQNVVSGVIVWAACPMNRYITRRYVAAYLADAERLAQLDGTTLNEIRLDNSVDLIHRTAWWAWWSDELLTTAIGLREDLWPERLSADAVALIDDVWMGELVAPQCGWALLARVEQIVACERVHLSNEIESSGCQEELTLRLTDNTQGTYYRCYSRGNNGSYRCDIVS